VRAETVAAHSPATGSGYAKFSALRLDIVRG